MMPGGAAALIGSFGARLGLDETDYARGILNANAVTAVFGGNFAAFVANPLIAFIGIAKQAGHAFAELAGDTLDYAESIALLASSTNSSTEFIQALRTQLAATGKDIGSAEPVLLKVVEAIDQFNRTGGPVADKLREIGVSLEGVTSTDEGVRRIIDGLNRMTDAQDRAAAASTILGSKAGNEFAAAIGTGVGAVDDMILRARDLNQILDSQTIRALGDVDDRLDALQQAMEGVKRTGMAEFLESFSDELVGNADDAKQLAAVLNDLVAPAMRAAGEATGTTVKNIKELLELMERLGNAPVVKQVRQGLGWLEAPLSQDFYDADFWRGANIEFQRQWFGDAQGNARANQYLNRPMGVGR